MGLSLDFVHPWWLLLLALVPWAFAMARHGLAGIRGGRRVLALVARSLVFTAIVLALAGTRLRVRNDRICVIFVVDRSDSIPPRARDEVLRIIRRAQEERDRARGDRAGIIVFGGDAGVEEPARERDLELFGFSTLIRSEATDIQGAIRLATASFPEDVGGRRIVLFSDGNETAGKAEEEARAARAMGIRVDVVPVVYSYQSEITVAKLVVPPEVSPGEPFSLQAVVESSRETEVRLRIFEDGRLIPQENDVRLLRTGKNFFEIPNLRREEPGLHEYEVRVEPIVATDDALPQNNVGRGSTLIQGEARVLLVASEPEREANLIAALRAERIAVDAIPPVDLPTTAGEWFPYGAVLFSNVGAHQVPEATQVLLENLVSGMGLGFVMIGGEESFGAGGWQGTPIARILPVDLDLSQKKVLPNGALAMVVHSCELSNGNYWASRIIQQAITMLSPKDYAGVIYYDATGTDTWLFDMMPCANRQFMLGKLVNFNPGDMVSFQSILALAHKSLAATPASIKHIVILTDGDPRPPSPALVSQIVDASRITISAICYGAHGGVVPTQMQQLTARGRGRFHFLQGPENLPEIFLREATVVRKAVLSEEPFVPVLRSGHGIVRGLSGFPPLDGYVLTSPRPLAEMILSHPPGKEDPSEDPVLAAWTYALGKVVAFTSDAGRRWGESWTGWSGYRPFWSQLVRWVVREERSPFFRIHRRVDGGKLTLVADLITPDGRFLNDAEVEAHVISPGIGGRVRTVPLRQSGPGRYIAPEISVEDEGDYAVRLDATAEGMALSSRVTVNVPYSPEYRNVATDFDLLARVAEAGDGRLSAPGDPLDAFRSDLEVRRSVEEIWKPLLLAALFIFFFDVAVRRIAIDPRHVLARVASGVRDFRERRRVVEERSDERLATLLRAKERVRGARARPARGEAEPAGSARSAPEARGAKAARDDEADESAPVFDERDAAVPHAQPARDEPEEGPAAGGPQAKSRGPDDPQAGETYTSRLLRAKKRALGDGEGDKKQS